MTVSLTTKVECFMKGHEDVYTYRARYNISKDCVLCGKEIHKTEEALWNRKVQFFMNKYPLTWRQYI